MNTQHLPRVAELYARRKSIKVSSLGVYAAGDSRFFECLAQGRVTIRRVEKVLQWVSDRWPEDVEWPPDVPRPMPTHQLPEAA